MLTHYYLACIRRNATNFRQAYSSFLLAANLATELEDNTYAGLSYGNVSCICRELYSGEDFYYADLSYQCHQATGDTARINWALMLKGIALNYQKRYPEAESIFDYLLHSNSNAALRQTVLSYYIYQCVAQHQYQRADSLIHLQQNPRYPVDFMCRAIVYEHKGQREKSDSCMLYAGKLSSTANDKVFGLSTLANLQNDRGQYQEASQTLFQYATLIDSLVRAINTASVSNIQRDYVQGQLDQTKEIMREKNLRNKLAFVLILLLIAGGTAFIWKKRKEKQRIIDDYMENVLDLRQTLLQQTNTISELKDRISSINSEHLNQEMEQESQDKKVFAKGFKELNSLCIIYFDSKGKSDEKRIIYEKVRSLIKNFSKPSKQNELELLIDANLNNAMEKAKAPEINLTNEELQLFRYRVAGFTNRSICLLMQIDNPDTVKKRVQRLRSKIVQSDSRFKDYLADLI
ncbi:MAG: hypothetical protein IKX59_00960 [Bacteroidales bacterium]|nr:hypothetical protein [Bacteroidales bacterium]